MQRIGKLEDPARLVEHLDHSPLGIILMDHQLNALYWSEQAEKMFGWKESEVLNRSIRDLNLVYEEDLDIVLSMLDDIYSGRHKQRKLTNRNKSKEGRVLVCDWYNSAIYDESGQLKSILSLVIDNTERVQLEHELSLIYNSAIDPMWLINIEAANQFRFQSINKSFNIVTGLAPEQVVGKMMEEVLPLSSHELVRTKYNEAIKTGSVIDYVEIAIHPAGKKYGEIRVIPIKNREGRVIQILGIANDITEKQLLFERLEKEQEELNRKLTNAAIKSQEMERSNVSRELHDHVNQVLTTVKLYTELCTAGTVDPAVYLPKCTTLLNETITEIRNLSKRLSAPSLGEVGVIDTIQDLIESVNVTGRVEIDFHREALQHPKLDSELHLTIYRIAQEHLTNILKHADASHVTITLKEEGEALCLEITDNGKGFDPNLRRKGIGITNMTSRARLVNGTLDIDSSPGNGCVLRTCIPVVDVEGVIYPVIEIGQ